MLMPYGIQTIPQLLHVPTMIGVEVEKRIYFLPVDLLEMLAIIVAFGYGCFTSHLRKSCPPNMFLYLGNGLVLSSVKELDWAS